MYELKKYLPGELETMHDLYNKASYEYYRTGEAIMSDFEFDALREALEFNGYDFTYDEAEPTETQHNEKLVGDSGMGSLTKVQVMGENMTVEHMNQIAGWLRQYDANIKKETIVYFGWKLDGNAIKILWDMRTGEIEEIHTRGNFSIKQKFHDIVRKHVQFNGKRETRCEAVMLKSVFEKNYMELGYANPRNLVAGILKDQDINDQRKYDVHFVELNDGINPSNTGMSLRYHEILLQDIPRYYQQYKNERTSIDYPTDGIVIYLKDAKELRMKGKYPLHSIAIKFPPVKVNAVIRDIEWNLKKTGEYIPKILLQPTALDGTTQKQVAAFNYGYVMENKLFPGAIVEIGKNGDIIAYVQRVITPGDQTKLKPLPSGSKIIGIHLMADGEAAIKTAKTERFIAGCYTLGLKNFGYAWFKGLSELCDNDIIRIFDKNVINIGTLNRYFSGTKKQQQFINKIQNFQPNIFNIVMMLQFPNCGWTTALQIARNISGIEYDFTGLQKDVVESCTSIHHDNFHAIQNCISLFTSFGYNVELMKSDNHEYDATFEMTGSPKPLFDTKDDFIRSVPKWGKTALKQGTTYLVTNSPESNTGKMAKARKLGIEILTYEQAIELYNKTFNQ